MVIIMMMTFKEENLTWVIFLKIIFPSHICEQISFKLSTAKDTF